MKIGSWRCRFFHSWLPHYGVYTFVLFNVWYTPGRAIGGHLCNFACEWVRE